MSDVLRESLPCVACGYELRGLRESGACPECGMSVCRSLHGDQLASADPMWLRGLTRGQKLVARGLLMSVIAVLLAIALLLAFVIVMMVRPGLPIAVENTFTTAIIAMLWGVPLGLCVSAAGVFLVMAQEPRECERESMWSSRNVARWSAVGAIVACVGVLLLRYAPLGGPGWMAANVVLRLAFIALLTTAAMVLLQRLTALMRRVPDAALAAALVGERKFIRWAVPAAGIYLLVLPVTGLFGGGGAGGVVGGTFACVGFIATAGLLLASGRLIRLMRQCAQLFRACAETAEHA